MLEIIMLDIREHNGGVLFPIIVKPKSKKNEVVRFHDGALRIKVTAPPIEGAANETCRKLLAKTLGVSKSSITIIKGKKSSRKIIQCKTLTEKGLKDFLGKLGL
ncbi:MAG: DUF167 domain-containing protein [Proteobacteria bacterium]|nr:DUF167 domain-containing protein [Pseudomonadota bacterium]